MKPKAIRIKSALFFLVIFCYSCIDQNIDNSLNVRMKNDPESLNPVTFKSKTTRQIFDLVYQTLFSATLPDGKLQPVLAREIPQVLETDSGFIATISLREEATWTDGSDVTSEDVAFTIKLLNIPDVQKVRITNPTYFIEKIYIIDDKNITFKFTHNSVDLLVKFDDFFIYPRTVLDPENLLKKYTLDTLRKNASTEELAEYSHIISGFNFLENRENMVGSDAYEIADWLPGQQVVLKRKKDYWFKNVDLPYLEANPEKIMFHIIPNDYSALIALENHQIDLLDNMSPLDFLKLQSDESVNSQYNFFSTGTFGITFLGLNAKKEHLENRKIRRAISHLISYEEIIEVALHGLGERTIGFIPPHQTEYYNKEVALTESNPDSAVHLFGETGFYSFKGKLMKNNEPLTFEILFDRSVKEHETTALLIRESMEKAGIDIRVAPLEKSLLDKRLNNYDFDMYIKSLFGGPFSFNYEYILHSKFTPPNGINYTSFGTATSDSLIYAIANSTDYDIRKTLLLQFQEEINRELNLIFLYNEKNNMAINKRYENLKISSLKPGYKLASFKLIDH